MTSECPACGSEDIDLAPAAGWDWQCQECGESFDGEDTDGGAPAKPICRLNGTDGNVFAIIGAVGGALKRAGLRDRADEWYAAAQSCPSYDAVLRLTFDYVDVR